MSDNLRYRKCQSDVTNIFLETFLLGAWGNMHPTALLYVFSLYLCDTIYPSFHSHYPLFCFHMKFNSSLLCASLRVMYPLYLEKNIFCGVDLSVIGRAPLTFTLRLINGNVPSLVKRPPIFNGVALPILSCPPSLTDVISLFPIVFIASISNSASSVFAYFCTRHWSRDHSLFISLGGNPNWYCRVSIHFPIDSLLHTLSSLRSSLILTPFPDAWHTFW